jgi:hypothetical protein
MKTKLSLLSLALFSTLSSYKAQVTCTMTTAPQVVYGTPGTYTIGTGTPLYIQVCSNVTLYDTLGSNQRKYYLLPGANLVLKGTFSQFVYMQGNSSVTRLGTNGGTNYINYEPTATINGTFQTSTNSCVAVSFPTLACSTANGIKEYSGRDLLTVFPNPANGFVNVINDHSEEVTASVVNSVGKIERVVGLKKGLNSIDLYGLEEGIYIINVSSADGTIARGKIVITQ